jgi:hypothetical protein
MMSRAPHPLAEAICDLAAPPLQATVLRLQTIEITDRILTVVCYIRQRGKGPDLEVSVYSGVQDPWDDDEGFPEANDVVVGAFGKLFTVRNSAAELSAFAADLLKADVEELDHETEETCKLLLPLRIQHGGAGWHTISLQLFSATDVEATLLAEPREGRDMLHLKLPVGGPMQASQSYKALASMSISNRSVFYAREQEELDVKASNAMRKGDPPPDTLPDSPQDSQKRYSQLRREAMDALLDALRSALMQARRYRGSLRFPGARTAAAGP